MTEYVLVSPNTSKEFLFQMQAALFLDQEAINICIQGEEETKPIDAEFRYHLTPHYEMMTVSYTGELFVGEEAFGDATITVCTHPDFSEEPPLLALQRRRIP